MALYIGMMSSDHCAAHRSVGIPVDDGERDGHTYCRDSGPYQFEVLLFCKGIESEKDFVAGFDALLTPSDTRKSL
jgi:hypothetical protein